MAFNAQKCYVLHITHSKSPIKSTYSLNNTILQEVPSYTYLGVDISNDLTWNSHVDRISAKANRTLGFLRRNLYSCPTHIKDMAYKTLVRPILDYCSSVWDPHTQTLINQLEAIQNRAARFVTGDYGRKSSVTAMKKRPKLGRTHTEKKSKPSNKLPPSGSPRNTSANSPASGWKDSQTHIKR